MIGSKIERPYNSEHAIGLLVDGLERGINWAERQNKTMSKASDILAALKKVELDILKRSQGDPDSIILGRGNLTL